jgi:L-aspartate oxidase
VYKAETISKCYDALIIGSGIAGLLLTDLLTQKGMSVLLACKGKLSDSNTSMAQGGLAAVTGANPIDSPALHLQDTLSAGAGLTDESVARTVVSRGRELVDVLAEYGINFEKKNGVPDMALEGGHSRARVLHNKDASGRAITAGLIASLRSNPNLTVWEDAFALDLLVQDEICIGAVILIKGIPVGVRAQHTILATGGLGQVFSRTTNPLVATGDGIAMAYRAGARVVDMEFIQFHPTALSIPGKPAALISEAVRGAGATLLDSNGQRFAFRFHKDGELATRDIVARAIYTTMMEEQKDHVLLDMRPLGAEGVADKFPNILNTCIEHGVDPRKTPIPIAPAAHYFMGGIQADITGSTTLARLYAIGECASTGLHGANRLASNSLLEGGVMALQLAETIGGKATLAIPAASNTSLIIEAQQYHTHPLSRRALANAAFECIGLERNEQKLGEIPNLFSDAPSQLVPPNREEAEHLNLELLTWLMANSALDRQESRGAHWRIDFAQTDDSHFRRRRWTTKEASGWLESAPSHVVRPGGIAVNY